MQTRAGASVVKEPVSKLRAATESFEIGSKNKKERRENPSLFVKQLL